MSVLEIPLHNPSVKGTSIHNKVINIGLLVFPELGRGMLAERVDKAVSMEHMRGPVQKTLRLMNANTPPPEYTHSSFLRHTDNGIAWRYTRNCS